MDDTMATVVKLSVEMLCPYRDRVHDPGYGSGEMFVQSEAFIRTRGGRLSDISIYGLISRRNRYFRPIRESRA